MGAYIFQPILDRGIKQGLLPNLERDARDWYRDQASIINNVNRKKLIRVNQEHLRLKLRKFDIGRMFAFFYDPKEKKKLKYYDRFPLIMVVDVYQDYFTGINFHYLPYRTRAVFFDELYDLSINKKYDDTTRLRLTYEKLKRIQRFEAFKPCFKRYLMKHTKSKLLYIEPQKWDIALFLNTQIFMKASVHKVWADSIRIIETT